MNKRGQHLTVACVVCGTSFQQTKSNQIYCSGRCGSRAWRDRNLTPVTLQCVICGKDFKRMYSHSRYCSDICATEADHRRKAAQASGVGKGWSKGTRTVPRRICEMCGVEFYAPPVLIRRGGGRFCGNDCRTRDLAMHPERYPQTEHRRGKGGRREDLSNRYFRSAWEANYARYLNWLVAMRQIARWEYEVDTFEFTSIKRGQRFYTPDFKITNLNGSIEYHEIKGWMDDNSRVKLDRMRRYYPSVKVVLIDKEGYYAIAKTARHLVNNWETATEKITGTPTQAIA